MRFLPARLVTVAMLVATVACAPLPGGAGRRVPYRFRAPILSGVAAADLPIAPGPMLASLEPRRSGILAGAASGPDRQSLDDAQPSGGPEPGQTGTGTGSTPRVEPSPVRDALVARIGDRTQEESSVYARRVLGALGVPLAAWAIAAGDGTGLAAAAKGLGVLRPAAQRPCPGDLAVFDDGWLIAVVSAARSDGVVEFVYAQKGVVRRGNVRPAAPGRPRGDRGESWNTFVRPYQKGDPNDQRYLAGQLLSGWIPLGSLAPGADPLVVARTPR